jgi:hypothetical protein
MGLNKIFSLDCDRCEKPGGGNFYLESIMTINRDTLFHIWNTYRRSGQDLVRMIGVLNLDEDDTDHLILLDNFNREHRERFRK